MPSLRRNLFIAAASVMMPRGTTTQTHSLSCVRYTFSSLPFRSSYRLYSASTGDDTDRIEEETIGWVKRLVVGWNLCPFAERPLKEKRLYLHTVRGSNEQEVLGAVLGEMLVRKETPGTTLVIAPECYPRDFERYLEFVSTLEQDLMAEYELTDHVQVAPFHPLFKFQGSDNESIDNYTNRSPYPMFHILREAEVETAVDKLGGDASRVWKRNVELLEDLQDTLGPGGVKDAIAGNTDLHKKVEDVLKRHRLQLGDTTRTQE